MFNSFLIPTHLKQVSLPSALRNLYEMKVDILENNKEFLITAELPGLNKDQIHVNLENNILTIATEETKENKEEREDKVVILERSSQRRSRSFNFNIPIDETSAEAKYENGLLKLKINKKEPENTSKRILIT